MCSKSAKESASVDDTVQSVPDEEEVTVLDTTDKGVTTTVSSGKHASIPPPDLQVPFATNVTADCLPLTRHLDAVCH